MDILIKLIEDNPWFGVVTAAIALASAITEQPLLLKRVVFGPKFMA